MSSPLAASSHNSSHSDTILSDTHMSPGTSPGIVPSQVLDTERFMQVAAARSADYRGAKPFPHIMLDGMLSDALLDQAVAELPAASAKWTTYNTVNESKQVCSDASLFGPTAEIIVHALNSAPFVRLT